MDKVLQLVAAGVAALGTSWLSRSYERQSDTPFTDDRRRIYRDYVRVKGDLNKSVAKVKERHGAEAHSP